MKRIGAITWIVFIGFLTNSCKEPFDPKLRPTQSNYLVVEGFINASGATTINLSRTIPLKDSIPIKSETNAQVFIEGEDNSRYPVADKGNGVYVSNEMNLNSSQKYRLHITTSFGQQYLSDFVPVRKTPSIDSIGWEQQNGGTQVYVNTHDPLNNTRYYRWQYEETWEINSAFPANLVYDNGSIKNRDPSQIRTLFYCWQSQNSTSMLTGSSVKLTNDVISKQAMVSIPRNSIKTSVRYSILVKQYALDKESFAFFDQMKKNTESLGSIFDPLPSEQTGNIHAVNNPAEKIIGFVTASTIAQKRIFITKNDVGSTYSQGCETTLVANNLDSFKVFYQDGGLAPYAPQYEGSGISHYYSSTNDCIDCRLRGTNVKPSFW